MLNNVNSIHFIYYQKLENLKNIYFQYEVYYLIYFLAKLIANRDALKFVKHTYIYFFDEVKHNYMTLKESTISQLCIRTCANIISFCDMISVSLKIKHVIYIYL